MSIKILFSSFLTFTIFLNLSLANTIEFNNEDKQIKRYYYLFKNKAIWIDENRQIKDITFALINRIKSDQILKPYANDIFELNKTQKLLEQIYYLETKELATLDKQLTKIYHKYMNYLAKGFINWQEFLKELKKIEEEKSIDLKWSKYEARDDFALLLKDAVKFNDINLALKKVNYTFPYAKKLEEEITRLEKIEQEGGYTKVETTNNLLKSGNYYSQIKSLRNRLYESNDLDSLECSKEIYNCEYFFDKKLFHALINFQKRHGLILDGIVGENTIEKLNLPIKKKLKTLRINLERMRWLPRQLTDKYILVNIPAYKLMLIEKENKSLEMDIIVGKKKHPTPVFSHKMSQIIVNPHWKIPQTIVKKEIIPKLVENAQYLEEQNIKVFENWDTSSLQYDVSSVDWSMYLNNDLIGTPKEAPMRFIQTPGGSNPLGKIKFLFPNQYSVYLHDTPEKNYFKMKEKTLSHGCIRVEKPFKLFNRLIEANYNENGNSFKLNNKIPIHIVYLTAWVEDNKLQFRDDIYDYDKIHSKLLFEPTF